MNKKISLIAAGTGFLVVVLLMLAIGFNLGPSKQVKRIGWTIEYYKNRIAAEFGSAIAQTMVGVAYVTELGAEKNYPEAIKWFRRAANQGDAVGARDLGNCYYDGYGVRKDNSEAIKWWNRAASKGDSKAMLTLGQAYELGEGVRQDYSQAKEWYGKSCDNGCQEGCDAYRKMIEAGH